MASEAAVFPRIPHTGRRQTKRPSNQPFLPLMFGKKLEVPETVDGDRTVEKAAGLLAVLVTADALAIAEDTTTGVLIDFVGGEITAEFSGGVLEDLDESSSFIHNKLKKNR